MKNHHTDGVQEAVNSSSRHSDYLGKWVKLSGECSGIGLKLLDTTRMYGHSVLVPFINIPVFKFPDQVTNSWR